MKTLKFLAQLGMTTACVVLMAGCNSSPSVSDAENALRQKIENESRGQIKLLYFKKTDGQKFEENGIKGYKMDYEVEIEFQTDGLWVSGETMYSGSQGELSFGFTPGQESKNSFDQLVNSTTGGKQVHQGDFVKIVGVMLGEKKESGWNFEPRENHIASAGSKGSSIPRVSAPQKNETERKQVMEMLADIDTAKVQWALETGSRVMPTAESIKPYLRTKQFPKHPSGGSFIIHSLKDFPESTTYGVLNYSMVKNGEMFRKFRVEAVGEPSN